MIISPDKDLSPSAVVCELHFDKKYIKSNYELTNEQTGEILGQVRKFSL